MCSLCVSLFLSRPNQCQLRHKIRDTHSILYIQLSTIEQFHTEEIESNHFPGISSCVILKIIHIAMSSVFPFILLLPNIRVCEMQELNYNSFNEED